MDVEAVMDDEHMTEMETRIKALEDRMETRMRGLEDRMTRFSESLLGTLDGKPGALSCMQRALELSERNSISLSHLTQQVELLRLDKEKVKGIILTVSILWAIFGTTIGLLLKYLL